MVCKFCFEMPAFPEFRRRFFESGGLFGFRNSHLFLIPHNLRLRYTHGDFVKAGPAVLSNCHIYSTNQHCAKEDRT